MPLVSSAGALLLSRFPWFNITWASVPANLASYLISRQDRICGRFVQSVDETDWHPMHLWMLRHVNKGCAGNSIPEIQEIRDRLKSLKSLLLCLLFYVFCHLMALRRWSSCSFNEFWKRFSGARSKVIKKEREERVVPCLWEGDYDRHFRQVCLPK